MQILKVEEFRQAVEQWDTEKHVPFLDFETNGREVWDPAFKIVCMSMAGMSKLEGVWTAIQVPLAHQTGQNAEFGMQDAIAFFIGSHSLGAFYCQAEVQFALAGLKVKPAIVSDPYLALRLLQVQQVAGLKDAAEKFLQVRMIRIEDILPMGSYDFSLLDAQDPKGIEYSEQDSIRGGQLAVLMEGKLIQAKMKAVYELEVKAAAIMAEESLIGYRCDIPTLERGLAEEERELARLEEKIFGLLGCQPFKINSGAQLGKALGTVGISSPGRTDKGAESWAQPVLESIAHLNEAIPLILEWKSRFSVRNTLRKSPTRVAIDGRIHPTWKSIGYDGTSRMYAEDPSITSLPTACRRAFLAPDGKRWVKFDWKYAEVVFLAAASEDLALQELLSNPDVDFHKGVYARMAGITPEEVTDAQREVSKVITYSVLYSGGQAYHVARQLKISMGEAMEKVREYFALFPKLKTFLDGIRQTAVNTRHVRTFMSRLRRLDGTDLDKIMNQACDAMGQQSCGTALKIALAKMANFHEGQHPLLKGLCQIIPVFDAIFYCIDADVPLDLHLTYMRDFVELNIAGVKLRADFATGPNWADLVKIKEPMAQAVADLSDPSHTARAIERKQAGEEAYREEHGLERSDLG